MWKLPATNARSKRKPALSGKTVVVIDGSAGMGLETARRARAAGADVILTGRDPERLERAAVEVGARSTDVLDAGDRAALDRFFDGLPGAVDHVAVAAARTREGVGDRFALAVAQSAVGKIAPGGTLLFVEGAGGRRTGRDAGIAVLAAALAPVRVRVGLVAPGLVDLPRSASHLGERLDTRRADLPVVASDDVAALAVGVMADTTISSAHDEIDGGRHLLAEAA